MTPSPWHISTFLLAYTTTVHSLDDAMRHAVHITLWLMKRVNNCMSIVIDACVGLYTLPIKYAARTMQRHNDVYRFILYKYPYNELA